MGGRGEGYTSQERGSEKGGREKGRVKQVARKIPKNGRRRPSRENNTNKCTVGLNRARKNEDVLGLWMEGQTPPFRAPPCLPHLVLAQRGQGAQVSLIVAQLIGQDDLLGPRPPKDASRRCIFNLVVGNKANNVTMPKSPNQAPIFTWPTTKIRSHSCTIDLGKPVLRFTVIKTLPWPDPKDSGRRFRSLERWSDL